MKAIINKKFYEGLNEINKFCSTRYDGNVVDFSDDILDTLEFTIKNIKLAQANVDVNDIVSKYANQAKKWLQDIDRIPVAWEELKDAIAITFGNEPYKLKVIDRQKMDNLARNTRQLAENYIFSENIDVGGGNIGRGYLGKFKDELLSSGVGQSELEGYVDQLMSSIKDVDPILLNDTPRKRRHFYYSRDGQLHEIMAQNIGDAQEILSSEELNFIPETISRRKDTASKRYERIMSKRTQDEVVTDPLIISISYEDETVEVNYSEDKRAMFKEAMGKLMDKLDISGLQEFRNFKEIVKRQILEIGPGN